jgi:parallel beta-helix repeat protein
LVINANLIQANMAESGSGGGIRLQQVNGTDVSTFPSRCVRPNAGALVTCPASGGIPASTYWNSASITNNIIVNNLAGWDGAGISLQDSLNVTIQNNTISSNDALASSGVLTQSIGTPEASAPAGSCVQGSGTTSCPQSAGVTSTPNSSLLTTTFTGLTITCPTGATNCTGFSNPILQNNVIWQNRSFLIGVGGLGTGTLNQQNLVSLFNAFTGSAAPTQTVSGQCNTGVSYWDIGVRGDTGPSNHGSGFTLNPTYSVLTSTTGYAITNLAANPNISSQYCNGSRVPPECTTADGCAGPYGYGVPPGIVDASTPNPVFMLTPSATVDEGNNWINVSWGPLELSNDAVTGGTTGNYGGGSLFGNYGLNAGSPAIDYVPATGTTAQPHPATDFFGNPRPDPANTTRFDVGAIEFQGAGGTGEVYVSPTTLLFTQVSGAAPGPAQTLTVTNGTAATVTGIAVTNLAAPFSRPAGALGGTCTTTLGLATGTSCTINIVFTPTAVGSSTQLVTITAGGAAVAGSPVTLLGSSVAAIRTAAVNPPGLGFFNQPTTDTSFAQTLTVTNTGNVALAGGTFTFGGGTPQPFARPLLNPGTCGATLAVGASCTINVTFDPATAATFNRTLTVAYSLGTVVTPTPVTLTGNGVAHAAGTLSFTGATGGTLVTALGARTLIFAAGASTAVVNVTNTGTAPLDISATSFPLNLAGRFSLAGTTCSFSTPLAPGTSCTFSIAVTGTTLDVGTFSVTNNGTPTTNGDSTLALAVP